MRGLSLSTKTAVALTFLVLVAVAGATGVSLYDWQARDFDRRIGHDVDEIGALTDAWAALRRANVGLSACLVDDSDPGWMEGIVRARAEIRARLTERERLAEASAERELFPRLRQAANSYDVTSDEVLALCRGGEREAARSVYLGALNQRYHEVVTLITEAIAINKVKFQNTLALRQGKRERMTVLVAASALLTALLGAVTLWLLYSGVFRPIRRMAEVARSHLPGGGDGPKPDEARGRGDLTQLGYYMRTLMTEVSQTRSNIEKNRSSSLQSERLAAIGSVVACVAHEIKNALTSIGGFARFIERRPDDALRVREEAQIILKVAGRLERMVRETMDYSRPMSVEPVVQSLNSLVADAMVAATAQAPEGVVLDVELDPAVPKVPIDANYLEDVITNLVSNAVDAVAPRGRVEVETRPHEGGALLTVRDSGPGIPPEQQKRIFEPFFTTKKKGNGLGLALCRQIVTAHGGTIAFESRPGKGTTFKVTLPPATCGGARPLERIKARLSG